GDFRQDLFFRLNVLPVNIPPLRERLEDLPELVDHFIADVCTREGRAKPAISPEAIMLMQNYSWPGNVRELQNICERAVVLCGLTLDAPVITRELIAPWLSGQPAMPILIGRVEPKLGVINAGSGMAATLMDAPMKQLDEIEREAIVQTLVKFKGHRQKTAHALGIGVRTLGLKLKKWKQTGLVAENL
ncbi:MAG: helix-turn-helix domain-containing protein, partial [Phycisphaerae bacterium]